MNQSQFFIDNPLIIEVKNGDGTGPIAAVVAGATKPALNVVVDGTTIPAPLPTGAATEATLAGLKADIDKNYGTWSYAAGVVGTVVVPAATRVVGISAYSALGGSLTINGGNSIVLPVGVAVNIAPNGNLVSPTIVFTGTSTYFVEMVA